MTKKKKNNTYNLIDTDTVEQAVYTESGEYIPTLIITKTNGELIEVLTFFDINHQGGICAAKAFSDAIEKLVKPNSNVEINYNTTTAHIDDYIVQVVLASNQDCFVINKIVNVTEKVLRGENI